MIENLCYQTCPNGYEEMINENNEFYCEQTCDDLMEEAKERTKKILGGMFGSDSFGKNSNSTSISIGEIKNEGSASTSGSVNGWDYDAEVEWSAEAETTSEGVEWSMEANGKIDASSPDYGAGL
mmetsp:Transcript_115018/g.159577  ORF Transcript_115018/g.159577 Transcript_115018/m.159577 type:complete len:124 (+) Transcript_115018:199-570(+)